MTRRPALIVFSFFVLLGLSQIILESYVDARAGGGRSGGFRGSRSYQSPSRPSQPSQPRREATPPPQQPAPFAPQTGGFMRTFGMALLGGFLGSMLFSGLAHGFGGLGGLGGSGFGLIEILLLAGLGYFLYRRFRTPAVAGHGSMHYQDTPNPARENWSSPAGAATPQAPSYDQIDYRSITMMDRSFDPQQYLKTAEDIFFKVQSAWNKQDTATLRALCGDELMKAWEEELAALNARGQRNKMENIALRESEITEAWTENGEDFVTVRLRANLLDYTTDTKSGVVVNGSDRESVEFEEYWTFSRPVGPNRWRLTAVQQA